MMLRADVLPCRFALVRTFADMKKISPSISRNEGDSIIRALARRERFTRALLFLESSEQLMNRNDDES